MKTAFTLLMLIIIGFSSSIISQNKIVKSENGFSIEIVFDEPLFTDNLNGILKIRDYPDFTDVSQSGKFKLPSKTFLIAVPPYSKPNITLSIIEEEVIKGVIPSI